MQFCNLTIQQHQQLKISTTTVFMDHWSQNFIKSFSALQKACSVAICQFFRSLSNPTQFGSMISLPLPVVIKSRGEDKCLNSPTHTHTHTHTPQYKAASQSSWLNQVYHSSIHRPSTHKTHGRRDEAVRINNSDARDVFSTKISLPWSILRSVGLRASPTAHSCEGLHTHTHKNKDL